MAAEDLRTMPVSRTEAPRTADDNIKSWDGDGHVDLEEVNRRAAADAGVRHAAFINYDAALDAYASRSDIEDLAHKNARDMPADFATPAFMRSTTSSQWDNTLDSTDATEAAPVADDYDLDGTDDGDEPSAP